MSADGRIKVVLCWHMHQPVYRDPSSGRYAQPWTYLHAIKDYVDMAALLEDCPQARVVVNFSPILLEQIADYAAQVRAFLDTGAPLRDPLLAALGQSAPTEPAARVDLLGTCLRANETHLINRYPVYRQLADFGLHMQEQPGMVAYLDKQYFADLVMWYHLAWLGETVRRQDVRVKKLLDKEQGFTAADRKRLLRVIGELLDGLFERYRRLVARGQIELSMNPYAHPIIPLLIDLQSAREAMPDAPLPEAVGYPDGRTRARWHIERGLAVFERCLGFRPEGCWPSEGSLSTETVALLGETGFRWTASGEGVLRNSLAGDGRHHEIAEANGLHHPYRVDGSPVTCFFRDDGLSDRIGFTYADWHGDDAASDFVRHLEDIARTCTDDCVVSIILDGENAWEYYPNNGYYFLSALYQMLSHHPRLELTTFSDVVKSTTVEPIRLPHLVAGSWVYGTFSTWIGDPDKNRAWDYLVEAKQAFDAAVAAGGLSDDKLFLAQQQLAVCEGSDWFWWLGDYNPPDTVSDFERLYRHHLTALYELIGAPVPAHLSTVMARGHGRPEHGGVMRHGPSEP